MNNLPPITKKQQAILRLIYRYRFSNTLQLQALMHHKDKARILIWLKDLRQKNYLAWIYDAEDFANKTKPATYYLSTNGIRWLRQADNYPPGALRKRYKEATRQPDFINRCLLIVDCVISLEAKTTAATIYTHLTEPDYALPRNTFPLGELRPQLYFTKQTPKRSITYLLEIIDHSTPRYAVKQRLKRAVLFLGDREYQNDRHAVESPIILIACPNITELRYAKRYSRKLIADTFDDTNKVLHLRFATTEQLQREGITAKIWEEL